MAIKAIAPLPVKPRPSRSKAAKAAALAALAKTAEPKEKRPTKPKVAVVHDDAQPRGTQPHLKSAGIDVPERFNSRDVKIGWRPYQLRFINDPAKRRVWVKAAQIGGSTALASWALGRCLNREKHLVVILSASDRQAQELAKKAQRFVTEIAGVEASYQDGFFAQTDILQHSIGFPNGSRIIAIPGRPETARGYTGDIILDEFAHHQQPEEIFTAAYRQVTLGDFAMLIASTPNGQQGKFYKMAHDLGLDLGTAPPAQPTKVGSWSGHWTDINLAVQEGLQVDPDAIRDGCDAMTWSQEYLCVFLSESELWITPEMVDAAVSADAHGGPPALYRSNLYAGWDVARSQNKSVIWFDEIMGDVSICRGIVDLVGMPTPTQIVQAQQWLPQIARMNIDKTGMGLVIAETLEMAYPGKCAGVQFTAATKEAMAVQMRLRLEQRKKRIPNDDMVRRSFLALRRSVNKVSQARFDSDSDEKYGHCYDEQTDLLTMDGWRRFSDLTKRDRVATLKDGELQFAHPTEIQRHHISGQMVRVANKQIDLLVTPNHKMYVRAPGAGVAFHKVEAVDLVGSHTRFEYKKDAEWAGRAARTIKFAGKSIEAHAFMRFMGLFISEGFTSTDNRTAITQKAIQKDSFIMSCLDAMPWKFHVEPGEDGRADSARTKVVALHRCLALLGKAWEKRIPRLLFGYSRELLMSLFAGLMHGDGSRRSDGSPAAYHTSSPGLADDVQELLLRLGLAGLISVHKVSKKSKNKRPMYYVSVNSTRLTPQSNKRSSDHRIESYNGMVGCCTVPGGLLFVRRNGKCCWSGNSDHFWAAALAEAAAERAIGASSHGGTSGIRFDQQGSSSSPFANFTKKVL
jgi:phage FluMu gp28-like protein